MRVMIAGQKWFGAAVFEALRGVCDVSWVCAPRDDRLDETARRAGVPVIEAGTLSAAQMPAGVDLIVAAHAHDFIGEATRLRARFGAIGYHPSLLPMHRGRDAIEWAVRMRDRVTGGTVYRLSNRVDGGPILAQQHTLIRPDDTARSIWERELAPLGVRLLTEVTGRMATLGYIHGTDQDDELASWEPSIGRAPVYRPDLPLLGK